HVKIMPLPCFIEQMIFLYPIGATICHHFNISFGEDLCSTSRDSFAQWRQNSLSPLQYGDLYIYIGDQMNKSIVRINSTSLTQFSRQFDTCGPSTYNHHIYSSRTTCRFFVLCTDHL